MLEVMRDLLEQMVQWSIWLVDQGGYPGIVLLMFLESSFVPFPSEAVMPQAGYLASQGRLDLGLAIVMGVVGSWLGALLNYCLAAWLGKPLLERYGRWLFCPPPTLHRMEEFFRRHGGIGTFTGRLIPVVRQYISLPAGLARMPLGGFLFYTGLGSGIWVTILAVIGYVAGRNRDLIARYSTFATVLVMVGVALVLVVYLWRRRRRAAAGPPPGPAASPPG